MGLWSKVLGYGMMAGGVAGAAFTGGASLALVPAGAGVLAADEKKEGAKTAEAQLETASNKAIATQTQARDAAAAASAPYTQTGGAAMSALGSFMGLPTTAPSAQGPLASGFTGGIGPGVAVEAPGKTDKGLGLQVPSSEAELTGRAAVPRTLAAPTVQTQGQQQTASGYTPLGGVGAGGLVQMRAPTGQTSWVPRPQVPFYAQRGAVEVA